MVLLLDTGRFEPDQHAIIAPSGERIALTAIECRLLTWLGAHPGRSIPHAELMREVWGYSADARSRTLYSTVGRVRQKVERDPTCPRHIVSVPGVGYRFVPAPSSGPAPVRQSPRPLPAQRFEPLAAQGVLGIVEGAYVAVESDEDQWLEIVLRTLLPHMDRGLGVHGYGVDASEPETFRAWGFSCVGADEPLDVIRSRFDTWLANMPDQLKRLGHTFAPCSTQGQIPPDVVPAEIVRAGTTVHRYADMFGLNGLDASGRGFAFAAPSARPIPLLSDTERETWGRIAVHLATAARLQRRLARAGLAAENAAEAVLTPDGKVAHATDGARAEGARRVLSAGVQGIERARSGGRRHDAPEALRAWPALVGGRWTLVDQVEAHGPRHILALPNKPSAEAAKRLTPQERRVVGALAAGHSLALIAYELGVAPSTVARSITRAMAKLSVTTRDELVRVVLGGALP